MKDHAPWHDDSRGAMHFWSVCHEGRGFGHSRDVAPRFCSKFGFQSCPSMHVIRTFAEPGDRNIASPVLEAHRKNAGGNTRMAETRFRYFRWPTTIVGVVYLSQVQQALAIQTAVDHWRGLKPRCMGTLYWQLDDTWPCASWSSLDYGGGWKLLHHMARRFYAPLRAMVVPQGDGFAIRAVNDRPAPTSLTLEAFAAGMTGATRRVATTRADVPRGTAAEPARAPADAVGPQDILFYCWATESRRKSTLLPGRTRPTTCSPRVSAARSTRRATAGRSRWSPRPWRSSSRSRRRGGCRTTASPSCREPRGRYIWRPMRRRHRHPGSVTFTMQPTTERGT